MREFEEMADDVDRLNKEIKEIDVYLFFFRVSMISYILWLPIMAITSFNPWVFKWVFAIEDRFWFLIAWWGILLFWILQSVDKWLCRLEAKDVKGFKNENR